MRSSDDARLIPKNAVSSSQVMTKLNNTVLFQYFRCWFRYGRLQYFHYDTNCCVEDCIEIREIRGQLSVPAVESLKLMGSRVGRDAWLKIQI